MTTFGVVFFGRVSRFVGSRLLLIVVHGTNNGRAKKTVGHFQFQPQRKNFVQIYLTRKHAAFVFRSYRRPGGKRPRALF